jgi:hypothetical protein
MSFCGLGGRRCAHCPRLVAASLQPFEWEQQSYKSASAMPYASPIHSVRGQTAAQEHTRFARRMRPQWSKRSMPVPERRSGPKGRHENGAPRSDAAAKGRQRTKSSGRRSAGH